VVQTEPRCTGTSGVYLEAMITACLAGGEVLRVAHWQALKQAFRSRQCLFVLVCQAATRVAHGGAPRVIFWDRAIQGYMCLFWGRLAAQFGEQRPRGEALAPCRSAAAADLPSSGQLVGCDGSSIRALWSAR
jgi:hypothetical protein